jgi:hypothetical protein
MLTVVCVLKESEIYTDEWVYKLKSSVERNLTIPFNFVCLTDSHLTCNTVPFTKNSAGWWNKIELFQPNLFTEETLYFDLDVIISKPLDFMITELRKSQDNFFMSCEEPFKNPNSSIMYWRGDFSNLYNEYFLDPEHYNKIYRKGLLLGDQGFISESVRHSYINDILPANYISWCKNKNIEVTDNTGFLIFLSKKCKPCMFLENEFIKLHWN